MSTDAPTVQPADDGAWRARLLASLRDCGVQRAPRNAALHWIIALVVLIVLAAVSFVGNRAMNENLKTEGDRAIGWVIRVIWLLLAIFVLNRLRNRVLRNAWQSSAASAEDELEKPDCRRPILYLRSFQLDARINQRTWPERFLGTYPSETAEQALTKTLRSVGPTIAIGRPEETLPSLGAARFYVSNDRWQQKVSDVANEAKFVVWATGTTEGLRWEISHLVGTVPPEKVILWAHPQVLKLNPREREFEWAKFRVTLGNAFPKPLPETLGEAQFFYFADDWTPQAVAPPRRPMPWFSPIRSSLRSLLAVKTGVSHDSFWGRWAARLGPLGIAILVGAIVAAIIIVALPDSIWGTREDGKVVRSYTRISSYQGGALLSNIALALVALSLGWGKSAWWRRTRMIGVVGLAIAAVGFAAAAISDEKSREFEKSTEYGRVNSKGTVEVLDKDYSGPPKTTTHFHAVEANVYLKLVLAIVVLGASVTYLKLNWRLAGAALPSRPPTAAEISYTGSRDESLADMIGATGPSIFWPRVAGFFIALAAAEMLPALVLTHSFSIYALLHAALLTIVAVFAFRFLSGGMAPVAAAFLVAVIWSGLLPFLVRTEAFPAGFTISSLSREFVRILVLLAGLSWATRRMGPRWFALWFGAMWSPLATWLFHGFSEKDSAFYARLDVISLVIATVAFAAVFELAIRYTPKPIGRPSVS